MSAIALLGARVLLDDGFRDDVAVLVEGGRIAAVTNAGDARLAGAGRRDLGGAFLLPGFIDCQVNGGGGALFNDAPSVETIRTIAAAHRRFGTTAFLPTLISEDFAVIAEAIEAVRHAIALGVPGVAGIHIEGPFINEAKRGAHDAAKIRPLDARDAALLASLRGGRTVVTLAPELTTTQTIAFLANEGVIVCAGHTNASFDEMTRAFAAGITGVTHLFNAMSPFGSREPGAVGAALANRDCYCGLIVDGRHVHPATLRIALGCRPADRFVLVTDAMPVVGSNETSFTLQGRRVAVRDGVCMNEDGTLAGSALDMASAVRNAVRMLDLPLDAAARMASVYPARFLGVDSELGRIARGYRANLVALDGDFNAVDTWIDGVSVA